MEKHASGSLLQQLCKVKNLCNSQKQAGLFSLPQIQSSTKSSHACQPRTNSKHGGVGFAKTSLSSMIRLRLCSEKFEGMVGLAPALLLGFLETLPELFLVRTHSPHQFSHAKSQMSSIIPWESQKLPLVFFADSNQASELSHNVRRLIIQFVWWTKAQTMGSIIFSHAPSP